MNAAGDHHSTICHCTHKRNLGGGSQIFHRMNNIVFLPYRFLVLPQTAFSSPQNLLQIPLTTVPLYSTHKNIRKVLALCLIRCCFKLVTFELSM